MCTALFEAAMPGYGHKNGTIAYEVVGNTAFTPVKALVG
jgi:hypothetical protein